MSAVDSVINKSECQLNTVKGHQRSNIFIRILLQFFLIFLLLALSVFLIFLMESSMIFNAIVLVFLFFIL